MQSPKWIALSIVMVLIVGFWFYQRPQVLEEQVKLETIIPVASPTPQVDLVRPPGSKVLPGGYHVFQTFNNCGPAALSMGLSLYQINVSQDELGQALRPFQVASGDNDDKSTTLEELAEKSKEYGFIPYHRPGGTVELIRSFITYDMPVLTRTLLHENDDIGHYRVVKGYDDLARELIQDDSLQGANLRYGYDAFNRLWREFGYEYVVLVPQGKVAIAEAILKDAVDARVAWRRVLHNPATPGVVRSVAHYHLSEYQKSIEEFEAVENQLSFRTLWYQIEPIQAYFEVGNYDKVLALTDSILQRDNRAFSELYLIRGHVFLKQGDHNRAREEFGQAVFYNTNLKAARDALSSL